MDTNAGASVTTVESAEGMPAFDIEGIEAAAAEAKLYNESGPNIDAAVKIAKKLQHVLSVYPGLNISMIQVGMGIAIKAPQWRPVFNWMRNKGYIREENRFAVNPAQQNRSYAKYFLAGAAAPSGSVGESTLHVAA